MALLMFDGFEAYDSPTDVANGGNWSQPGFNAAAAYGFNGKGVRRYGNDELWTRSFAAEAPTTLIVGARLFTDAHSYDKPLDLVGDQGTTVVKLVNTSGTLSVVDGDGTTLWTDTEARFVLNVWDYWEVKAVFAGASSRVIVRKNAEVLVDTGTVTISAGANVSFDHVRFFDEAGGVYNYGQVDDVYVCDGTGTVHNDLLGPVVVHALRPNADSSVQFTPSTGTTNYSMVDDVTTDNGSTYVESNVAGEKDVYDLSDLPANAVNPQAVQVFWRAAHSNTSGGASAAGIMKSGVTEIEGPETVLNETYATRSLAMYDQNPDTAAAWDVAGINALQVGAIVKSNL